jgi:hypothetical protein
MSEVLQHEIGLTGEVAIRVRSGDVRLSGVAGTLARVRARGGDALRRVSFEPTPGALAVHSRSSDGLDVEVPTGVAIRLEAGSADLELRGLRGTQQYRTASGDIRGRGLAGDVTIEALSGDVDLVLDGPGRLQARTVSGDLAVRAGILAAFRGATTSGDLRVAARFEGSGPFAIETVSGDAVVAPAGPVRVETSTRRSRAPAGAGPWSWARAVRPSPSGRRPVTCGSSAPWSTTTTPRCPRRRRTRLRPCHRSRPCHRPIRRPATPPVIRALTSSATWRPAGSTSRRPRHA